MSIRKWEPLISMHKLKFNEAASKFLFILICGDVFYFLLHVVYLNGFLNSRFNLEKDWSLPESYQYLKFLWCFILLVFIALRKESRLHLCWLPLFAFLLADDGLRIHEQIGGMVSSSGLEFQPPLGLRRQDIGELIGSAAFGLPLLLLPAYGFFRANSKMRSEFLGIGLLVLSLAFFGIVVDMSHEIMEKDFNKELAFIEDGGEMLSASLMLGYIFFLEMCRPGEQFNFFYFCRSLPAKFALAFRVKR